MGGVVVLPGCNRRGSSSGQHFLHGPYPHGRKSDPVPGGRSLVVGSLGMLGMGKRQAGTEPPNTVCGRQNGNRCRARIGAERRVPALRTNVTATVQRSSRDTNYLSSPALGTRTQGVGKFSVVSCQLSVVSRQLSVVSRRRAQRAPPIGAQDNILPHNCLRHNSETYSPAHEGRLKAVPRGSPGHDWPPPDT